MALPDFATSQPMANKSRGSVATVSGRVHGGGGLLDFVLGWPAMHMEDLYHVYSEMAINGVQSIPILSICRKVRLVLGIHQKRHVWLYYRARRSDGAAGVGGTEGEYSV